MEHIKYKSETERRGASTLMRWLYGLSLIEEAEAIAEAEEKSVRQILLVKFLVKHRKHRKLRKLFYLLIIVISFIVGAAV